MVSLTRPHRLSGLPAPPSVAYSTHSSRSGASTEVSSSAGGSGSGGRRGALRQVSSGVDAETAGLGGVGCADVGVGVRREAEQGMAPAAGRPGRRVRGPAGEDPDYVSWWG